MGTRADFYVGRGKDAEWLGSIAMDGYHGAPGHPLETGLIRATSEDQYRAIIAKMMVEISHATPPELGWPWPWEDSNTTDYAYAFDGGKVHANCFGHGWYDPCIVDDDESRPDSRPTDFPKMTPPDNPFHDRSGLIIISS